MCSRVSAPPDGLAARPHHTQVVRRNEAVPATGAARPVLVATRNDALASVIASTPADRRKDLVFMQVCSVTALCCSAWM